MLYIVYYLTLPNIYSHLVHALLGSTNILNSIFLFLYGFRFPWLILYLLFHYNFLCKRI